MTPLKAIRAKCLDCCGGQANEVRLCPCPDCTLYPFRFVTIRQGRVRAETLLFPQKRLFKLAIQTLTIQTRVITYPSP